MQPQPAWVGEVLQFWFEDVGAKRWFAKDEALDEEIRQRFLGLHKSLLDDERPEPLPPLARLAAVIVLDQFSRNMFRGTPRAFAQDAQARRLAKAALDRSDDVGMNTHQRMFLYMPLQHSEDRADQARSVALTRALGDANLLEYAQAHQAMVERFGRFPHRNAALGRPSTPEEVAYMEQTPQGF